MPGSVVLEKVGPENNPYPRGCCSLETIGPEIQPGGCVILRGIRYAERSCSIPLVLLSMPVQVSKICGGVGWEGVEWGVILYL